MERKQEVYHDNELDRKDTEHKERMKELDRNFTQRKDFVSDEQNKVITQMRKEHKLQYKKESELNSQELKTLGEEYRKAIIRQKQEQMADVTKYEGKTQDPFYKNMFFENELIDRPGNYFFQVEIPEHERDNIDVRVQKEKITISGIRQHKENFTAEGQRFKTNSSQSFYQEIPLKDSVKPKEVKTWFENGTFKLVVPKV